ncbi:hypothetical protein IQ250_04605 [Pseudanabaenaceae cyanobacterium LEGE 13415]|nr:hypothetical protein [Pseudanabaenaceae cyanobacterium LEGE 13415]
MKSADPDQPQNPNVGAQRAKERFDKSVQRRIDRERTQQLFKTHAEQRQALINQAQSSPEAAMAAMRTLMSNPTLFPVNATAVPVTEIDDATIDAMSDEEIDQLDIEAISNAEPAPAPEVEKHIQSSVQASAYWLSIVGMLSGLDGVVDEFADATTPEERENSEMTERAIALLDSIANKIKNLKN